MATDEVVRSLIGEDWFNYRVIKSGEWNESARGARLTYSYNLGQINSCVAKIQVMTTKCGKVGFRPSCGWPREYYSDPEGFAEYYQISPSQVLDIVIESGLVDGVDAWEIFLSCAYSNNEAVWSVKRLGWRSGESYDEIIHVHPRTGNIEDHFKSYYYWPARTQ